PFCTSRFAFEPSTFDFRLSTFDELNEPWGWIPAFETHAMPQMRGPRPGLKIRSACSSTRRVAGKIRRSLTRSVKTWYPLVEDDHAARRPALPEGVDGVIYLFERQTCRDHFVELEPSLQVEIDVARHV